MKEQDIDKIEDLIAEFGDNPAICLGIISEHLSLTRHAIRNPGLVHSITAGGSCNMGCC